LTLLADSSTEGIGDCSSARW